MMTLIIRLRLVLPLRLDRNRGMEPHSLQPSRQKTDCGLASSALPEALLDFLAGQRFQCCLHLRLGLRFGVFGGYVDVNSQLLDMSSSC